MICCESAATLILGQAGAAVRESALKDWLRVTSLKKENPCQ